MYLLIRVELVDAREQFLPRGLCGQGDVIGADVELRTGFLLVADIDLGCGIVSDDDNGKAGIYTVCAQCDCTVFRARLDACGKFLPIQYACHSCSPLHQITKPCEDKYCN